MTINMIRQAHIALTMLLLAAFFMPWIQLGRLFSAAGYEIPFGIIELAEGASQFTGGPVDPSAYFYLSLYLFPLMGIIHLVNGLRDRIDRKLAVALGVVPFVILGWAMNKIGGRVFEGLGIGAWITLLTGLGILVLAVIPAADAEQPRAGISSGKDAPEPPEKVLH